MYKILLLGPQGSGKGTQAERLSQRLGIPTLSMGQLLRDVIAEEGILADRIRETVHAGGLVSDDIAITILDRKIQELGAKDGYILDGFPRNEAQLKAYDAYDHPTHVVVIEIPRDISLDRIAHRSRVERRVDDTPEVIAYRLDVYEQESIPMLAYYEPRGIVRRVDGMGTVDEVEQRIKDAVGV
ncbi:nucleoside monophosphate kinase [bacterium]|nr:nucleoside monophosphate kinase [bacterium]